MLRTIAVVLAAFLLTLTDGSGQQAPAKRVPTFNRDVAPIIFENCVSCHYPGSTPFSLASYSDVKRRTKLISDLTKKRLMPPWLPEPGHGDFIGVRRLTDEQIATLEAWAKAGGPQGNRADLKVKPQWSEGWQLGEPDIVVTLPEAYELTASGPDVYRNFVIPNAIPEDASLTALEFKPNSGAVHHAFIYFNGTEGARRLDARDQQPGFAGMEPGEGSRAASAMFCSWQPGKRASEAPPGFATALRKGTDVVLQMHMRCTGRRESIKPSVALYFTKQPATRVSSLLLLRSVTMDIPPGDNQYVAESSYKLPVDVEVLSVLPHMHYLGKEAHGWAILPDGTRRDLLLIKRWDFNWQGDYRYVAPVALPKGSTLHMRYIFDNSTANTRNPNRPPKRVTYGIQSSDEMAELWMQLALRSPQDRDTLNREYNRDWSVPDGLARAQMMVKLHPKDGRERTKLARVLVVLQRFQDALKELEQALADDSNQPDAYYIMGSIYSNLNDAAKARAAYTRAVELDPQNPRAHNNLGWVLLAIGNIEDAIHHFEKALELDPNDELARTNLNRARSMLSSPATRSEPR